MRRGAEGWMRRRVVGVLWAAVLVAGAGALQPGIARGQDGGTGSAARSSTRLLVFEEALRGTEDREVRWPVAVASASPEELAVADAFGARLLVFRRLGAGWQAARGVDLPAAPVDLVRDGGRYVVSLRGGGGLIALEGEELLQRRLALPEGVVPGALAAVPGGGLLVHDRAAGRILRMAPDGRVLGETPGAGRVTGLAAAAGGVLAAFGDEGVLRRYDEAGRLEATWPLPADGPVPPWPAGLAVTAGGRTLVVDRHNGRVVVLDPAGRPLGSGSRQGWDPGLLRFPEDLALLPDGRIAVADQGNGRIQLFRRSGEGGP
ncbi:MAG: hypothetical protein ACLF0P_00925 [Thermoanaerobaculia bacterium]